MRISDHLNKDQKKKINQLKKPKSSKKKHSSTKKNKEERVDWIDIMGMNRDRFGRGKGGAMRRK